MRCTMLAIMFSAFGWIASAGKVGADEPVELILPLPIAPAIDLSTSTSSRIGYVELASSQSPAEESSPPERASQRSSGLTPSERSLSTASPAAAAPENDLTSIHGYRPPLPFGPSGTPAILQYMTCDPFSCPNIWQGWEAQRAADLAKKCSLHCSGHCGCGCGRTSLYHTPCTTCSIRSIKPVNRYRPSPSAACGACGKSDCDGLIPGSDSACAPCQSAAQEKQTNELSAAPAPSSIR